jgi:uncharacterized protein YndB with AHSA1/START domain
MKNDETEIVREIEINAPVDRVWSALTDAKKFEKWFKVSLDSGFVAGKTTTGKNVMKGFEMQMAFHIQEIKPKDYFSYKWTPFPMDQTFDYSKEEPTLVEFFLSPTSTGTHLKVRESGFTHITASRRAEAIRMHTGGWEAQLKNIEVFVGQE